jgi:elongator complex protein 2
MFSPPFNIIKFLKELTKKEINFKNDNTNEFYEKKYKNVEGSKQALGLMNREVILEEADDEKESNFDYSKFDPDAILTNKSEQVYVSEYNYKVPPDEDFLSNNTLWPEEAKMYGHGNEVYTIDISHDGKFLASGQKAQEVKNAKLYLWDINNKKLIKQLDGCTLTIVQISFSPNDNFMLTVSRDRSWNLYIKNNNSYEFLQNMKNAHKRIIWSCSWTLDEKFFATGSRDKFINIWKKGEDNKFKKYTNLEMKEPVTAIEFIGKIFGNKENEIYIFIAGLESGKIIIGKFEVNDKKIEILYEVNKFLENGAKTQKIRSFIKEKENICYFATCSEDFTVRIFNLNLSKLEEISIKQ